MNLESYKRWYVLEDAFWYIPKMKQFNENTILEFSQILKLFYSYFNSQKSSSKHEEFVSFLPEGPNQQKLFNDTSFLINIDFPERLFISIKMMIEGLIDLEQLEQRNQNKFRKFIQIQRDFLEKKNYHHFIKNYGETFLKKELTIYYRNSKSWFKKFGFYDEFNSGKLIKKRPNFTEIGIEFLNSSQSKKNASAIFHNQIKKFQIYNPSYPERYKNVKVVPYYILLDIIIKLGGFFTKTEFVLFISRIKSHDDDEIVRQVNLIKEFRELTETKRKQYINEVEELDRSLVRDRQRTIYDEIYDASNKIIDAFIFKSHIYKNDSNSFILNDESSAKLDLSEFIDRGFTYIHHKSELDWISYMGSLDGMNINDFINNLVVLNEEGVYRNHDKIDEEILETRILERNIEDYYEENISEIDKNLIIYQKYGKYGRQYSTHIGRIDLLCFNTESEKFVVCEIKKDQSSDETVGQLLRYIGWVKRNLAENDEVLGVIISKSNSNEKIKSALIGIQHDDIDRRIKLIEHNM